MASRRQKRAGHGKGSVDNKLEERLHDSDYYGALQIYKALYSRHINSGDFTKAVEVAYGASMRLLKHKEETGSSEMGILMIDAYAQGNIVMNDESKARVNDLNNSFIENGLSGLHQANFLKSAVKWSALHGPRARGDPSLQYMLAVAYVSMGDFAAASRHFLHAEEPLEFTNMLIKWSKAGYNSEQDLFLGRAVLQLLSLENLRDANIVYKTFLQKLEKEGIVLDSPLIHFLDFLMRTIERDALSLFQMLKEKYATSISRDSSFNTYLQYIGQKFYNLKPPQTGLGALMNMFGGGF